MTRFFSFFIQVSFFMACLASPGFSKGQDGVSLNASGSPTPVLQMKREDGASSNSAKPVEYFSFGPPSPKRPIPTRLTIPEGHLSLTQASDDSCSSEWCSGIQDYFREVWHNCLTWCVKKCDDCDDDDASPEGGAAPESDDD